MNYFLTPAAFVDNLFLCLVELAGRKHFLFAGGLEVRAGDSEPELLGFDPNFVIYLLCGSGKLPQALLLWCIFLLAGFVEVGALVCRVSAVLVPGRVLACPVAVS